MYKDLSKQRCPFLSSLQDPAAGSRPAHRRPLGGVGCPSVGLSQRQKASSHCFVKDGAHRHSHPRCGKCSVRGHHSQQNS